MILYHRISGAIGLTDHEDGTRGAWVEKRRNVLQWLVHRKHTVAITTRLTKATRAQALPEEYSFLSPTCAPSPQLIMLEFGPSNGSWYAEDYATTQELLRRHPEVPVVYLCDDPDLLKASVCRYVPQDNWSRWTFLLNCDAPDTAPAVLGAPTEATYGAFNPSVGMPLVPYVAARSDRIIYPGRPGGRKQQCLEMIASGAVLIVGNQAEWSAYPDVFAMPSPDQSVRGRFYQQFAGLLCAFDKTHALMGWRTGRAYHALCAGVPVLAFKGNSALWWTKEVHDRDDIADYALTLTDDSVRQAIVNAQRTAVSTDETSVFDFATCRTLGL